MTENEFQFFSLGLGLVNFAIATLLILYGLSISRQIGASTFSVSAQENYEALLDERAQFEADNKAERYYNRLWAGQVLQFEQWRRRLIPDLIYCDWLAKRREQYIQNVAINDLSFRDAWDNYYSVRYKDSMFGKFMNKVFENADVESETLEETFAFAKNVMRKHRRFPLIRF